MGHPPPPPPPPPLLLQVGGGGWKKERKDEPISVSEREGPKEINCPRGRNSGLAL